MLLITSPAAHPYLSLELHAVHLDLQCLSREKVLRIAETSTLCGFCAYLCSFRVPRMQIVQRKKGMQLFSNCIVSWKGTCLVRYNLQAVRCKPTQSDTRDKENAQSLCTIDKYTISMCDRAALCNAKLCEGQLSQQLPLQCALLVMRT